MMKHHTPGMRLLYAAVWIITAIGSLHIGLMALNYNLLASPMLANLVKPIEYIFGIAGLLSLILFFMHSSCGSCNGSQSR